MSKLLQELFAEHSRLLDEYRKQLDEHRKQLDEIEREVDAICQPAELGERCGFSESQV